jgi:hypothetical protein
MAKLKFLGIAQAVSQIDEVTLGGTWTAGEKARLLINGKYAEYTVQTSDTAALVAAGLQAAAVLMDAEFTEITFTVASTKITATGTAGVPFTMTVAELSSSGTIATTTTQAATGPNHWNNAANWSTGAVPVNSDEVFLEVDTAAIYYGFPTGLELTSFAMSAGSVGLPDQNALGYVEYRARYLTIGTATLLVTGGDLVRINTGVIEVTATVNTSGAVDLISTSSDSIVNVLSGTCRLLPSAADTGAFSAVRVNAAASLYVGPGTTIATLRTAGQTIIDGGVVSLQIDGGTCTLRGTTTTVTITDGEFVYSTSDTITTLNLNGGTVNCGEDIRARTITTFNFVSGQFLNPHRVITFTNGIQPTCDAIQAS